MDDKTADELGDAWIKAGGGWRPGMLWTAANGDCPLCRGYGGFVWREADGSENGERCPCSGRFEQCDVATKRDMRGALPEFRDPGTRGAALEAVREHLNDASVHLACRPGESPGGAYRSWFVERVSPDNDDNEWLRESGAWGEQENGHRDPPIECMTEAEALVMAIRAVSAKAVE
jgi:hypothetical protein